MIRCLPLSLTFQHDFDAPIPKAGMLLGQTLQPLGQCLILLLFSRVRLVTNAGAVKA